MSRPAHHNRRGLSIWRANHFDGVCVSELVCHLANMQFTINFEFQTIQLLCAKESENYLQVKWLHRYDICVNSDVLVSHEHTICFGISLHSYQKYFSCWTLTLLRSIWWVRQICLMMMCHILSPNSVISYELYDIEVHKCAQHDVVWNL